MAKARFFPSESVRRAEVAVIDSIAAICAEHGLAYQLVPADGGTGNRVAFRLEFYPDPGLPFEQLVMRRTYHWICRSCDLPYDLPGRWFHHRGVLHQFLGASLDTPPKHDQHYFLAIETREKKIIRLTADEVRAEVVFKKVDALANTHFAVGLEGVLPGALTGLQSSKP